MHVVKIDVGVKLMTPLSLTAGVTCSVVPANEILCGDEIGASLVPTSVTTTSCVTLRAVIVGDMTV